MIRTWSLPACAAAPVGFFRASGDDRSFLVGAAAALLGVRVSVSILPLSRLRSLMLRGVRRPPQERCMPGCNADRLVWAVASVGRRLPGVTCRVRALAAHLLLAWHGHSAQGC